MDRFESVKQLEDTLSLPGEQTPALLAGLKGDLMILGAGGKMGPTLARLLLAATEGRKVYAVSRFSDPAAREGLEKAGITTIAADLLDRSSYERLPDAPNIWFLAGMKFGASSNEPLTWAMNSHLPALVCERFSTSRIVAFSTGNVYPLVPVTSGGATEETPPGPVGEYAQSCLGRERIFEYFSAANSTPVVLVRLNYANEPRYGVISDVVQKVLHGEPIDLRMGFVNVIWQADANDYIARAVTLADSPAAKLNIAGPETVSVRFLAEQVGNLVGKQPVFVNQEEPTALLSSSARCVRAFGYPRVGLLEMVEAITDWAERGMPLLGKPTKFQVRNGKF